MRLFVAVYPPPWVAERLAEALRPVPRRGVRWADPAQWHATLRFLGDVEDVTGVERALDAVPPEVADRCPGAVEARLGPATGWLPGGAVLQVPVAGLDVLAAAVDAAVAPWVGPADHPFLGHLTVGRSRSRSVGRGPGRVGSVAPVVDPWTVAVEATWTVEEVVLVGSELGSGPAVHRAVRRVPLLAPR